VAYQYLQSNGRDDLSDVLGARGNANDVAARVYAGGCEALASDA
jgi:hypothetical protein